MKVIASDLDGCLAHTQGKIEEEFLDMYGLTPAVDEGNWAEKYPSLRQKDVKNVLIRLFANPDFLLDAEADEENIAEWNRWVLLGMAPSIITRRDPISRAVTELWMSQHTVAYSNFLLGIRNKGEACWHVGASFMIEDGYSEAMSVATQGIQCYLLRKPYNIKHESEGYPLITFVDNYKEISEIEGF